MYQVGAYVLIRNMIWQRQTLKNPKKFGLLFKLPLTSLYKKSLTVAEKLKKHSQVVWRKFIIIQFFFLNKKKE